MRMRVLGAAVVAALAAATLSACNTNVGLAVRVGSGEISESHVESYLLPGGVDTAALAKLRAQVQSSGQTLGTLPQPRAFVLHFLIEERLLENALRARGESPTAGQLSSLHDSTVGKGAAADKRVRVEFRAVGANADLVPVYSRVAELEGYLNRLVRATSAAQFYSYVVAHGGKVSLNPRYGTWDPKTLSVTTSSSSGTSNFLTLQPTGANGS